MNRDEIVEQTSRHSFASWLPQVEWNLRSRRRAGLSRLDRRNEVFCCPPLIIEPEHLDEGLQIIDQALAEVDRHVTG